MCPSMRIPFSLVLRFTIRASRSAWGTFLAITGSGFVTCSLSIASSCVWLSNSSRFSDDTPPTVAPGSSWRTHAAKSSLEIGWPGWPCANAKEDIVVTPEFLRASWRVCGTLTWSNLKSNCASESMIDAIVAAKSATTLALSAG